MRWLWNYGMRWLGGRVWRQATQAAASRASESQSNTIEPACVVAVVCSSKNLFDAIADATTRQRNIKGHRFTLCTGHLAGRPVVIARTAEEGAELIPMLTALVDGHHPPFLLSVAEGECLSESVALGELVVADRVFGPAKESLRIDSSPVSLPGIHSGGVASKWTGERTSLVEEDNAPLVCDGWSWPVAVAAKEVGLPMMVVSLVLEPIAAERSKDVDALKKQPSTIGKAGVLVGMAWKKRSAIRELWSRQEARWEASGRLVALVRHLIKAC